MELDTRKNNEIIAEPVWKTLNDKFIPISQMDTHHLFYTVRMIWNHVVPKKFKLYSMYEYTFSSWYTKERLQQALCNMLFTLAQRSDIKSTWKAQLNYMFTCIHEPNNTKKLEVK